MKRLIAVFLFLTLVVAAFAVPVSADTIVAEGVCGAKLTWKLYDNDRLTISGTGKMYDFTPDTIPWAEYLPILYAVTLEKGVTSVGNYAFYGTTRLSIITLPDTLQHIGDYAFSQGDSIFSIELPSSLRTIGEGAFTSPGLTGINLNEGLTTIGDGAFAGTNVSSAIIPKSVTSIGNGAYRDCGNLSLARIYTKNLTIHEEAFAGCTILDEIHFYSNAPVVKNNAFAGVTATVYHPAAHWSWTDAVRQNYGGELLYCAVDSNEVTSGDCGEDLRWSLAENGTLTISGTGPMVDFNSYSQGTIIRYWDDYLDQIVSVVVKEGVTYIGDHAFYRMPNLKSVKIADSVTEIGSFAFKECPSLTSISFGSGLKKVGTDAFLYCTALKKLVLPNCDVDYGNNMFLGCTSLTDVTIPAAQTTIGGGMFEDCTSLTEITIPDSIATIGSGAFQNTGLKQIQIPESVTTIGQYAFQNCHALKEVTVPGSVKTLGHGVFAHCQNLEKVTLSEGLEQVGDYLLKNTYKVTEITIPSTVVDLGNAFGYTYGLQEIHFKGDYPICRPDLFTSCTLTAYYPHGNETWTQEVLQDYGGTVTWKTAQDHTYAPIVTEPTCTEPGYTTHTCPCGDSYVDSYTEPLGHSFGEWKVTKEPTDTEKGIETRVCACGEAETREIDAAEYLYGDVNGNGVVDSDDAALICYYDAELIGGDKLDLSVGDVTGDGYVDSDDAALICYMDAEIIDYSDFPCFKK